MPRIVIRTGRKGLVLKQLIPRDAPQYFALIESDRPHLSRHMNGVAQKYPTEASVLESIVRPKNSRKLRFGIWDGATFVGSVNLTPLGKGRCELGGWTGKLFCNKGYASTAWDALARYALAHLGFTRVIAKTHRRNFASQATLKKAGFIFVRRFSFWHYFALTAKDC